MSYKHKKYFNEIIDLIDDEIDNNNFKEVYNILSSFPSEVVANFNLFMLDSGIDILKYLDHVPAGFLFAQRDEYSKIGDVIIPSHIKHIDQSAYEHSNIESVKLEGKIDRIGYRAFFNCENLTHVDLSAGVNIIESQAFNLCHNLKQIILPKDLKQIGLIELDNNCEVVYLGSRKE